MKIYNGFRLESIDNYDYIICLDYGHGNCTATQVIKSKVVRSFDSLENNNKKYRRQLIERLSLDPKYQEIPTAILYAGDAVKIGVQAAGKKGCRLYFKNCPDQFEKKSEGITYGKLTFDFIRELMNSIRRKNNIPENARILLLVGCPTHRDWLEQKNLELYAKLLKEASGAGQVIVLQESRAAVINAYNAQDQEDIWITQGILVVDFGSSTTDCTWLQTGKKPFEFSWRLGAHEIEEGMLALALQKMDLSAADLSAEDKETYLWVFRRRKEMFYNGEAVDPVTIHIYELDPEGEPVIRADGSKKELRQFEVNIDDAFMNEVTNNHTFTVKKDDDEKDEDSYVNHCRKLFMTAKSLLEGRECRTIVLTGGASQMAFIRQLCEEIFCKENGFENISFPYGGDPSFSVSMGLAYAILQDLDAERKLKLIQDEVKAQIDKEISDFISRASKDVSEVYKRSIAETLDSWQDNQSVIVKNIEGLRAAVNKALTSLSNKAAADKKIQKCYTDMAAHCETVVQECVNNHFSELYHNILPRESYQIREEQWKTIFSAVNLSSFITAQTLVGDGRGLAESVVRLTLACVLFAASLASALLTQPARFLHNLVCKAGDEISYQEWQESCDEIFKVYEVASVDTRELLSYDKRKKIVKDVKEKLPAELEPRIKEKITANIEAAKASGKIPIDQMVMDALEDAVELIAFYS